MDRTAGAGLAGQVIAARYRLDVPLGAGGTHSSWLALDTATGRAVGLACLQPPPGLAEQLQNGWADRAEHRAWAATRLPNHPNLVRVLDVARDGPTVWVASASVQAATLADTVRAAGPVPVPSLVEIGIGLADGLSAVHALGLAHGGVHPSDVLVTPAGRALLSAAGGLADDDVYRLPADRLAYLAPERWHGAGADPAGDMYSLGAVLYFAAEGRPPPRPAQPAPAGPDAYPTGPPVPPPMRAGPAAGPLLSLLDPRAAGRPTAQALRSQLAGVAAVLPARSGVGDAEAASTTVRLPPGTPLGAPPAGTYPPPAGTYPHPTGPYARPAGPYAHPGGPSAHPASTGAIAGGVHGYPGPPPGGRPGRRTAYLIGAAVGLVLLAALAAVSTLLATRDGEATPAAQVGAGPATAVPAPSTGGPAPSSAPSPTPTEPAPAQPSPQPSASGTFSQPVRENFTAECEDNLGAGTGVCECLLSELEMRYTEDEFYELWSDATPETYRVFDSIATLCLSTDDT